MANNWRIERLDESHQRGDFSCAKPRLDDFLRTLVGQYQKRGVARTYVAVAPPQKRVCGYYSIAAGAVPLQSLPRPIAKKRPKHPVPVVHLGRLAVDQTMKGRGLGSELLMDALRRSQGLATELGIVALEVYAIDADAKQFYLKFGFLPLEDDELHLYLAMSTIKDLIARAGG